MTNMNSLGLMTPFNRLHLWMLGKENFENPVESMRVRVLLSIILLTGVFMWGYAFLGILVIHDPSITFGFLYAFIHLCSIPVFKKTRSYHWATTLMLFPGGLFQAHFSLLSGGIRSATMVWVAILPLIAGVLTGPKKAVYWAIYAASLVGIALIAEQLGYHNNSISAEGEVIARLMVLFGMIIMCAGFTIYLIGINHESETKLKAKSVEKQTLLRILVHDIANPLMVLKMRIETLKEDWQQGLIQKESTETQQSFLALERNLDKIEKEIRLVRELEAAESGKVRLVKEFVFLLDLFNEIKRSFESQLKSKSLNLQTASDPTHKLLTSPVIFESQILNNLITNAIKFTPEGGDIRLSSVELKQAQLIEISVCDNGVGIPAQLQAHLFDPNVPTTRTGTNGEKGTGFGLPIVKSTIETLGGKITVESTPNKGTTFRIQFPLQT